MDDDAPVSRAASERGRQRRCPICGAPAVQRYRVFCSARCRDRDLGHWLSGAYAVPAVETDEDADADDAGPAPPSLTSG